MTHAHEATPGKLIGHHNPARVLRELARLGRVPAIRRRASCDDHHGAGETISVGRLAGSSPAAHEMGGKRA